jgi:uncharacterized RDD family membrane protein YckC
VRSASLGQRIGGSFVDFLVLSPLTSYLAWRAWDTGGSQWYWIGALVEIVYVVVPTALWGQTAGKRLAGSRVVMDRAGPDPESCTWPAAVVRSLVPTVPGVIPVVGTLLGLAVLIWTIVAMVTDDLHRGVHDRAAGTRVIDVRPRGRMTDRYRANVRAATVQPRPVRKRRRARP